MAKVENNPGKDQTEVSEKRYNNEFYKQAFVIIFFNFKEGAYADKEKNNNKKKVTDTDTNIPAALNDIVVSEAFHPAVAFRIKRRFKEFFGDISCEFKDKVKDDLGKIGQEGGKEESDFGCKLSELY
ncbi:MAG: hypothetical protein ABIC19_03920 [Patescibacteria group bacterium]|nr:hypothetical protein [Patescibacteria group bacterium]